MADVIVDIRISVAPATNPLTVDASGVPGNAQVGVAYSGVIKASGGTAPYAFTDVSAAQVPPTNGFPKGLVLNADGTITGTPTDAGDFDAVVDVADSAVPAARATARVRR